MATFRQISRSGPLWHYNKQWYTQAKPWKSPLPFVLDNARISNSMIPNRSASDLQTLLDSDANLALSKAQSKLKDKLGDSAELGVTLVEWKRTAALVNQNALRLLYLATLVGQLNKRRLKRLFRQPKKLRKRARRVPRDVAGLWLEYSFAWAPLVNDIYTGLGILSQDPPSPRIRARGTTLWTQRFRGNIPTREFWVVDRRVGVQLVCDVKIANPNLFLLQKAGLLNPVAIVWELVPWSFVVDWFTNLGQVMTQFSDFAGLDITNSSTTTFGDTRSSYTWIEPNGTLLDAFSGQRIQVQREIGLQTPTLLVRPFTGFSITRGANALSLAIQQLGK